MKDKIYRHEAIDVINNCGICTQRILDIPAAQPERKTGRWILKPNIYGVAYCSECNYELHTNNTNYCPNCGARMSDGE